MQRNILITGGTGLLGSYLTHLLQAKGYQVNYLSRRRGQNGNCKLYQWDVTKGQIDTEALESADALIHLAGANVGDKLWTDSYRKEIYDSRIESTKLLHKALQNYPHRIKTFIGASAVGLYGVDTQEQWIDENSPAGTDFLATVVRDWEAEIDKIAQLSIRTVKIRIGIVLARKGGALEKMAQPVRFFAGAAIGTGKQFVPWIHIDDLCNLFIKALEDNTFEGAYNGVAPNPTTNAALTRGIGKVLGRPIFLPNVPTFVLKMGLGEFANSILGGNRISCHKVQQTGFVFKYPKLEQALEDLLK